MLEEHNVGMLTQDSAHVHLRAGDRQEPDEIDEDGSWLLRTAAVPLRGESWTP